MPRLNIRIFLPTLGAENVLVCILKFIYKCKLSNAKPSLRDCVAKVKTVYEIERQIAIKLDKVYKHYKKWGKILPCVQQST